MTAESPKGLSKREQLRALRDAKVNQGKDLIVRGARTSGKALSLTGRGLKSVAAASVEYAGSVYSMTRRGLVTVDGLTVTFPILPEKSGVVAKKKTISVNAEKLEDQLIQRKRDGIASEEEIGRDRIGLPIIIQLPLHPKTSSIADKKAQKLRSKNRDYAGKTVPGVRERSETKDSDILGASENVAFLEVGAVTPDNNYLHRLNFGLGVVDVAHKNTLISQKSIPLRTPNAVPQGVQSIDFSPDSVVVDDVAKEIMKWVTENSCFTVAKEDIYTALTIASRLNTGMEDFWKTVHARKYFEFLLPSHPEAMVMALNIFLTSNKPREALGSLFEFYNKITRKEFDDYKAFVEGAREATAGLPEDTVLMVNLGMGPLQQLMNLTTKSILNREQAQKAVVLAGGLDPEENTEEFQLLTTGDPLSTILLSPRLLSGIVKFVVEKYIPLQEAIILSNLKAVEQGLITAKAGSDAVAAFQARIRESFEKELPKIYKEIEAKGPIVAQDLADKVTGMLNTSVEEAFGTKPGLTYNKPDTSGVESIVVSKKLEDLKAKAIRSKGNTP